MEVCLLVRRLFVFVAVSLVVERHHSVRLLHLKAERVLFIGTVFGTSLYFLVSSCFRAQHLRDKVFSPPSRHRSRRSEQEG